MINKPPFLNRDSNRDPYIKVLKRRGFINHGFTLISTKAATAAALRAGHPEAEALHPPRGQHESCVPLGRGQGVF